jgi:hypothetical protein
VALRHPAKNKARTSPSCAKGFTEKVYMTSATAESQGDESGTSAALSACPY